MQIKPTILIVTDEDKAYSINHYHYKTLEKPVRHNEIKVVTRKDITDDISIYGDLTNDGKDFYILNPYSNIYIKISCEDFLYQFLLAKSHAVKEALVCLGAKRIIVTDKIKDVDTVSTNAESNASSNVVKGSINVSYKGIKSAELDSCIESCDANRKPKPYQVIKSYIDSHGLSNDCQLKMLLERLERDGILSGSEKYSFSCLQEVNSAINILANLNVKIFNTSLDFSIEHNHIHEIKKELSIEF